MNKIRAHHLFCMPLFSGCGYDQAFTENMGLVIHRLKEGESFLLCQEHDVLCNACPNLKGEGRCSLGDEDVESRDQAAMEVLGLQPGMTLTWQAVIRRLRSVSQKDFSFVCGGCRWNKKGLCSWRLLLNRTE